MVDVFDRHGVRFDPRLAGCSRFVRHSDYAALEAQLAEAGMIAAWQRRLKYPHNPGAIPQWEQCTAREATGHFERQPGYEYRPLYTAALEAAPPAPKVTEERTWGEIPNARTDDAHPVNVLAGVLLCAESWEPEARIIGNVRAGDIARAIRAFEPSALAALTAAQEAGRP